MDCPGEEIIQCFVEGRLTTDEVAALEAHLAVCPPCDQLLAAFAAAQATVGATLRAPADLQARASRGALARGTSIGRYTVLELVGRGGMGEVYAAYDPRLDRRIALKLLRAQSGSDAQRESRLLREAQVIARLSHANVITVYDVGAFEDRVFLAMEYVDGQTLASWLAERTRTRDEILAAFGQAARGLAAAHAAGLVHRDFKPQNVMVARDGTVRVTDFGVARRIGDDGPVADATPAQAAPAANERLTQTGELLGTPLYMAPEQLKRKPADARSDQFSFCVALYEALYGEHPFHAGGGGFETFAAVLAGRVKPAPARSAVPTWIRRTLLRGLSLAPEDRWPSMDDLMAALALDPARKRRRWVLALAMIPVMALIATLFVRATPSAASLCGRGADHLVDVWPIGPAPPNEPRRAALRAAFVAAGVQDAADTLQRASLLLDRYAGDWLRMYRQACEATHLRGEQSSEVLDLRMACLDERRAALKALTDVLANADAKVVTHAVDAVAALSPLDRCADIKLLRAPVEPPRDARTRAQVDDLRRRANTVKALDDTGHHEQALTDGRKLLVDARAVGYPPVTAELLAMVGSFRSGATFQPESSKTLEDAFATALRARRDDIAAEAAVVLTGEVGYYLDRREEGERWAAIAEALLDRLGEGHERLRSWSLQGRADIHLRNNELEPALRLTREALALKRRVLPPDHPDIARTVQSEAVILHEIGDDAAAFQINEEARRHFVDAYGARSPYVAATLANGGEQLNALGRPAEALPRFREALVLWEADLEPEHPFLGYPLTGMGRALIAMGRPGEARPPLERALKLRIAHEPDPALRAETRFALAQALWATGDRARAVKLAEDARDDYGRAPARSKEVAAINSWLKRPGVRSNAGANTMNVEGTRPGRSQASAERR